MIRLRLTMILWVSWISFFFFFLCHFNSFHTGSVTRKQKIILFFYQVFGAFIWILHSALIISLFFFTSSTSLLFLLCLLCPRSCASFCRIQRSDSQMRQQVCRFAVSVSCRFWFLPLSIFSQLVFWNVKICPSAAFTAVVSASVRCCFFIPHLLLSVFISLSLQSDRHGRMCCLFLCSSYGFSFFSSFSVRFFFAASVLSLALPMFLRWRWKHRSCRLFVVFARRVFPLVLCHTLRVWRLGSNELTHRALLMCSGGIS